MPRSGRHERARVTGDGVALPAPSSRAAPSTGTVVCQDGNVAGAAQPLVSGEMRISTRRFCERPVSVALEATASASPLPDT